MAACLLITLAAWGLALLMEAAPALRGPVAGAHDYFYDTFYRLREVENQTKGDVVIVAVDQKSLDAVDQAFHFGWPWPREFWGQIVSYLDKAGARAVAFDMLFSETSAYQDKTGDDELFAEAIGQVKTPVVFGSSVAADGSWGHFAPPIKGARFGAVNVGQDKIYRRYLPRVNGRASLATAAAEAAGGTAALPADRPFLLHYYGPHQDEQGRRTFKYISAAAVLGAQLDEASTASASAPASRPADRVRPELFKGKIVLIGAITTGTFDLKSSPLSSEYPGVEVQATALENLLQGRQVMPVGPLWRWLVPLLCSVATTAGVLFPRRATVKAAAPVLVAAGLLATAGMLFTGQTIQWLTPVEGLTAVGVAALMGFSWTYLAENRQRRFMLKALSKVVSPAIAEQLAQEPEKLALGTTRTEATILFTDLANFTNLSESMDVQKLGRFLNRYLVYMSAEVLAQDGTLDKYIGDAIMCFWNAPLLQADHAARACRAALAIKAREEAVQQELREFGGVSKVYTRIGINTATVALGFVGSEQLLNYTVLGDGVNLASRLEGANKLYGTQILLSETTAALVQEEFILRKVDVLRVKGKRQPMAVYELMADCGGEARCRELARDYEEAFGCYQRQEWDEAERQLKETQRMHGVGGYDIVCESLLERIRRLRRNPPGPDWDGVYEAKEK